MYSVFCSLCIPKYTKYNKDKTYNTPFPFYPEMSQKLPAFIFDISNTLSPVRPIHRHIPYISDMSDISDMSQKSQ